MTLPKPHRHRRPYGRRLNDKERRAKLWKPVQQGMRLPEMVELTGISKQTLWGWMRRFNWLAQWRISKHQRRARPVRVHPGVHLAPVRVFYEWTPPVKPAQPAMRIIRTSTSHGRSDEIREVGGSKSFDWKPSSERKPLSKKERVRRQRELEAARRKREPGWDREVRNMGLY